MGINTTRKGCSTLLSGKGSTASPRGTKKLQQSLPTCVGYALTHALLLLKAVLRALGSGICGMFVQVPLLSKRQPW
jgi:hypothetical protein